MPISELIKAQPEDDHFVVSDQLHVNLSQVVIVGVVRSVQQSPNKMEYQLDDYSGGLLEVQHYVSSDEAGSVQSETFQIGQYVEVVGHLRVFSEMRSVVALNVRKILSYNEVTTHLLRILHDYGLIYQNRASDAVNNQYGLQNTSRNIEVGYESGFTSVQKQVYSSIKRHQSSNGCSMQTLNSHLAHVDRDQLNKALDFLSNEGHIYSTIDDEHFMTTD
ncbi:MAG: DNA-directed RNA polymerase I subunit rpa2 [Paramarteilia canceri]